MRIDLFCRVIDNGAMRAYAGVWHDNWCVSMQFRCGCGSISRRSWRLGKTKRTALTTLQICTWSDAVNWSEIAPADAVIEAFACEIPADYVRNMAQAEVKPHWVNLEYLSAELWVEGSHLLPSPQSGGLTKRFFFPGFTEKTGGLLRERDLLAVRDRFVAESPQFWVERTSLKTMPAH